MNKATNLPKILLIAADQSAICEVYAAVGRHPHPFNTIEVADGPACRDALSNNAVDIAFIDVDLVGADGMTELAIAHRNGRAPFTVLISSTLNSAIADVARQLGVYELLIAPIAASEAIDVLVAFDKTIVTTRLLMVDQSTLVRQVIRKVLATSIFNFDIEEAPDVKMALQLLSFKRFDLALIDSSGKTLGDINALRQFISTAAPMGVIVTSAEQRKELADLSMELGAAAFFRKPFYAPDVDLAVRQLYCLRTPNLWKQQIQYQAGVGPHIYKETFQTT